MRNTEIVGKHSFRAFDVLTGCQDWLAENFPYHLQLSFTEMMSVKGNRTRVGNQEARPELSD
jgi:hypothetical protein